MSPDTKKISDNIYRYWPRYFANGGHKVKWIEFYQYSYTVLAEPTPWLIFAISATYHLATGIADVTNAFQNTLKDSSDWKNIDCLPHYLSWF